MEKEIDDIIEEEIKYAETFEYNRSGRAIIEIGIEEEKEFFSPYCIRGDEVLKPELDNYIMTQANNLSPNKDIEISISSSKKLSDETKEIMITAIRRKYGEKVATTNTTIRRNLLLSIYLLLVGAIFQVVFFFALDYTVPSTIIELIAWVFCWEALDNFILIQPSERINRKRYIKLLGADIKFRRIT